MTQPVCVVAFANDGTMVCSDSVAWYLTHVDCARIWFSTLRSRGVFCGVTLLPAPHAECQALDNVSALDTLRISVQDAVCCSPPHDVCVFPDNGLGAAAWAAAFDLLWLHNTHVARVQAHFVCTRTCRPVMIEARRRPAAPHTRSMPPPLPTVRVGPAFHVMYSRIRWRGAAAVRMTTAAAAQTADVAAAGGNDTTDDDNVSEDVVVVEDDVQHTEEEDASAVQHVPIELPPDLQFDASLYTDAARYANAALLAVLVPSRWTSVTHHTAGDTPAGGAAKQDDSLRAHVTSAHPGTWWDLLGF